MSVELCNTVSAPEHLDTSFFQEVLENGLADPTISLQKVSFAMGSGGGENYCSQIYRVTLTGQRGDKSLETVSVIVKSIIITDSNKFLEDLSVFLKEKIFYYSILPRLEVLTDKVKFGAKLYHDIKHPINTLVFEDLSALGYVMANREKGLDLRHSQLVMEKIGLFHGVSMVLVRKDPNSMKAFGKGILAAEGVNGSPIYETLFGSNIEALIRLTSTWKGYEKITEKIKAYASELKQNLIKSQLPIEHEFRVLNHGDLWVNNLLFKYEGHQVEDVVFVDHQMSIFGSPGFDLNYFLYSSVQLDVLKLNREQLLSTYHRALSQILYDHDYPEMCIPKFDDILSEVRQREMYGFFTSFGVLPIVAMDKSKSADNDLDAFADEDMMKKKTEIMFSSSRLQETLRFTLKRFEELGVLDDFLKN